MARGGPRFLRACAAKYGDLVELRLFWKPVLFVNHPDYVGQVLATLHGKVGKGLTRHVDRGLLGEGLSLRDGDDWLRERRVLQPAFQRERLTEYGEVVVALAEQLMSRWRDGEVRDLYADMTTLALATVARSLFGVDLGGDYPLAEAISDAFASRNARARSVQVLLPDWLPSPAGRRVRRARRRIDALLQPHLDTGRPDENSVGDLLAVLLGGEDKIGRGWSDRHVKDEIVTLLVGGTETVAGLLTWAWYLIAQHPDVEARLLAEVDAVVGERLPTPSDVKRLPYLGAVVSETLRLYPPASVLAREALTDVEIGPCRVSRGTTLAVSPWVMQRDPRFFASPDTFDPDRWTNGLASRLPPYAYFPFGGGPRLCIGRSLATMEAILVLASLARRYRFALLPDHPVVDQPIPTLRPKYGLRVKVCERIGLSPLPLPLEEGAETGRK
jgi:cytochrome P450